MAAALPAMPPRKHRTARSRTRSVIPNQQVRGSSVNEEANLLYTSHSFDYEFTGGTQDQLRIYKFQPFDEPPFFSERASLPAHPATERLNQARYELLATLTLVTELGDPFPRTQYALES